jgi:hypothetical protein
MGTSTGSTPNDNYYYSAVGVYSCSAVTNITVYCTITWGNGTSVKTYITGNRITATRIA